MKICDRMICTGCTACYATCPVSAISMNSDETGFLHPSINEKLCIDCDLCKHVCPVEHGLFCEPTEENIRAFALVHKSDNVLERSASGGAFMAACEYLFNTFSGNVVCFGAMFSEDCKSVIHGSTTKLEGVKVFSGSKYIQSQIRDAFSEVKKELENHKHVFFTGTPCQIDGLKHYLSEKCVSMEQLILCDIICHGVPSPLVWLSYLNFIEDKNHSKVVYATTRSKRAGWRNYSPYVAFENGTIHDGNFYSDVRTYMCLFFKGLIFRESCYHCQYSNIQRVSDITIADFWGIEKVYSRFDTPKGVSLVLTNTSKGQRTLDGMKQYADIQEAFSRDYIEFQNNLRKPTDVPQNHNIFWEDFISKGYQYVAIKYGKYDVWNRIKCFLKRIIVKCKG